MPQFSEVKILHNQKYLDNRGYFSVLYNQDKMNDYEINQEFVQDNYSVSLKKGVIRGLHFQIHPYAQAKLVSVVKGKILDVIVDIRHGSSTFGSYMKVIISEELMNQVYIPEGFAHGFCTLEDDTRVMYKVTAKHSAMHDRGILWHDPELGIDWPVKIKEAIVSEKDSKYPTLSDLSEKYFTFQEK